jgi:stage 0 sporulation protein B (sporulation initiation phosphotransferase)
MKDADVIQLIQHYRHDLMNHLQVVQGYISMNKAEKAGEKLKETMDYYNEERKLMHVMPPDFILWVMQVNIIFDHIRLEYQILTEKKLHHADHHLSARCQKIIAAVNKTYGTDKLYEIIMQIKDTEISSCTEVNFLIRGENNREALLSSNLNDKKVLIGKTPSGMECSFLI